MYDREYSERNNPVEKYSTVANHFHTDTYEKDVYVWTFNVLRLFADTSASYINFGCYS